MSYTPQRSPRVTLPPRTREFNPLERHTRGGGCGSWAVIIGAGLLTGLIIAVTTLVLTNAPLPFLAPSNTPTATLTAAPRASVVSANPTVTNPPLTITLLPTATRTNTPLPPPTNTRTATAPPATSPLPARADNTATATVAPKPSPTVTVPTAAVSSNDLQLIKLRFETDPALQIAARNRTFTFYATFLNNNTVDYTISWGVGLYLASSPNAINSFGDSAVIRTSVAPGTNEYPSGVYNYTSGGERNCFIARVFQVTDANPRAPMRGPGQDYNFCVGN